MVLEFTVNERAEAAMTSPERRSYEQVPGAQVDASRSFQGTTATWHRTQSPRGGAYCCLGSTYALSLRPSGQPRPAAGGAPAAQLPQPAGGAAAAHVRVVGGPGGWAGPGPVLPPA